MWGRQRQSNQVSFWVVAEDSSDPPKDVLNGPFGTESQARQESGDLGNVKVYRLYTVDRNSAKRKIKAMRLKKTGSIFRAMLPIRSGTTEVAEAPVQEKVESKRSFFEAEGEDLRNS